MEGLIPFIIGSIRKQQLYSSYRCLSSDGSTTIYHLLAGGGDFHGGAHGQAEMESPDLPVSTGQPYGFDAAQSCGLNKGSMLSGAGAANACSNLAGSCFPQNNKDEANGSAVDDNTSDRKEQKC